MWSKSGNTKTSGVSVDAFRSMPLAASRRMAATSPVRAAQTRCPCGSLRRSSADGEKAPHDAQAAAASSRAARQSISKLYHELLSFAKSERTEGPAKTASRQSYLARNLIAPGWHPLCWGCRRPTVAYLKIAMQPLSTLARFILDRMEPDRHYGALDLRAFVPDASVERLGEVMHEL